MSDIEHIEHSNNVLFRSVLEMYSKQVKKFLYFLIFSIFHFLQLIVFTLGTKLTVWQRQNLRIWFNLPHCSIFFQFYLFLFSYFHYLTVYFNNLSVIVLISLLKSYASMKTNFVFISGWIGAKEEAKKSYKEIRN